MGGTERYRDAEGQSGGYVRILFGLMRGVLVHFLGWLPSCLGRQKKS